MSVFKERGETLCSPVKGRGVRLSQLKDPIFSSGILGFGIAILPEDGCFYSPCDGEVEAALPHAVTILAKNGAELLVHVGIDTVSLEGKGFRVFVKEGERVKKGQLLIKADLDFISSQGFEAATAVVVCNSSRFPKLSVMPLGDFEAGQPIIETGAVEKL